MDPLIQGRTEAPRRCTMCWFDEHHHDPVTDCPCCATHDDRCPGDCCSSSGVRGFPFKVRVVPATADDYVEAMRRGWETETP